ncbi:MAG: hypothetical protein JNL01_00855 [Bdellovibrionales bacterium]|nr:hypothetical protein [Bdellovibrionales bacterium]
MKTHTQYKTLIGFGLAALILSACGGQVQRAPTPTFTNNPWPQNPQYPQYPWPYPSYNPYPWPTGTPSPTPSPSTSPNTNNTPSYSGYFSLNGVNGVTTSYTMNVNADTTLKVKVTADSAGPLTISTGSSPFTANYSCAQFTVTVGGRSVQTQKLLVGGIPSTSCPDGVASQTIDFSDRLQPGVSNYSVKVESPRYDFYCIIWMACQTYPYMYDSSCSSFTYNYYTTYCPMRSVFKNHTVNGGLEVFTY